eukprot:827660-Rhodomonas_salina.3
MKAPARLVHGSRARARTTTARPGREQERTGAARFRSLSPLGTARYLTRYLTRYLNRAASRAQLSSTRSLGRTPSGHSCRHLLCSRRLRTPHSDARKHNLRTL